MLAAARSAGAGRLVVLFQPALFTRTQGAGGGVWQGVVDRQRGAHPRPRPWRPRGPYPRGLLGAYRRRRGAGRRHHARTRGRPRGRRKQGGCRGAPGGHDHDDRVGNRHRGGRVDRLRTWRRAVAERRPPSVANSQKREADRARPSARGQVPKADVGGGQRPCERSRARRSSARSPTASRPRRRADRPSRHSTASRCQVPRAERPASPAETRLARDATAWTRVGPKSAPIDTVTHRMRERLAERKRTERRRALVRFGRWAAVAAVVVAALWAFFMSPLFCPRPAKVEVLGMYDRDRRDRRHGRPRFS